MERGLWGSPSPILPLELLDFINQYVSHKHLLVLAQVGYQVTRAVSLHRTLKLYQLCEIPDIIVVAYRFPSLFELVLMDCRTINGDIFAHFAHLPSLRKLTIYRSTLTDYALTRICLGKSRKSIKEFNVGECKRLCHSFLAFSSLPALRRLDISYTKIDKLTLRLLTNALERGATNKIRILALRCPFFFMDQGSTPHIEIGWDKIKTIRRVR